MSCKGSIREHHTKTRRWWWSQGMPRNTECMKRHEELWRNFCATHLCSSLLVRLYPIDQLSHIFVWMTSKGKSSSPSQGFQESCLVCTKSSYDTSTASLIPRFFLIRRWTWISFISCLWHHSTSMKIFFHGVGYCVRDPLQKKSES